VVITGLINHHASLRAQPVEDPVPTSNTSVPTGSGSTATSDAPILLNDEDKPWNQGVSLEDRRSARELLLEGNRRFRIPLFTKAAERYVAALSKWKHPAFYFNLALAQLNLSLEVEARENLEHALQYGEEPLGVEQFQEAQKQLQEVERRLGRIRVSCRTPGAKVVLDGMTLFTGPGTYEGWAKAQDHEITARRPGYLFVAKQVTVSSGELQVVELKLITLSEAADASRRWTTWKPWLVIAAGGTIVTAAGLLQGVAARNFNAYNQAFPDLPCADPQKTNPPGCPKDDPGRMKLDDLLRRATRQQEVAVGGYLAGSSLVAAGVVLLYLNRPRLMERGAALSSVRNIAVVPAVSTDMVGISVTLSH